MRKSTDTSRIKSTTTALGDLNHEWTLEDEREFKLLYMSLTAEELADHFKRDKYECAALALEITRQQELMEQREQEEGLEYSRLGHLKHNPSYHVKKGHPWSTEDMVYLCKYHDIDGLHSIGLALNRPAKTCASQLCNLRKSGMYYHYRNREELA